jgi:hypothetical protein
MRRTAKAPDARYIIMVGAKLPLAIAELIRIRIRAISPMAAKSPRLARKAAGDEAVEHGWVSTTFKT